MTFLARAFPLLVFAAAYERASAKDVATGWWPAYHDQLRHAWTDALITYLENTYARILTCPEGTTT